MTPGEVIHFDVPHSSSEKRENIVRLVYITKVIAFDIILI